MGKHKKNSTDGKLSLNEAWWKQHNSPLLIACQDSAYLLKIIFFEQTIFYRGHGQGQFCLLVFSNFDIDYRCTFIVQRSLKLPVSTLREIVLVQLKQDSQNRSCSLQQAEAKAILTHFVWGAGVSINCQDWRTLLSQTLPLYSQSVTPLKICPGTPSLVTRTTSAPGSCHEHVSRARVTCCVTRHLQEVDVVAVHHDQAPAPGPGRVLQPRVLGRGHAQPHQGVRGARGGGLHLIVSTKFRSNIYVILRSFKDFYNPKKWQTVFKYCHNTLTYIHK